MDFLELSQKIRHLDVQKAFNQAMLVEKFQQWIIATIQKRLYDKGWDSDGKKLRTDNANETNFYSDFTLNIKDRKGQKKSNVTLNDTGDFYNSFKINVQNTFFKVEADFFKEQNHIFDNFTEMYNNEFDFEDAITNLSESELHTFLHDIIYNDFMQNLKNQL